MNQKLKRTLVVLALGNALAGCYAGVAYDTDYPSAGYVSSAEPVYYEGRPVYWYHDRWYYRDGRGWRHYDREPVFLHERRTESARRHEWRARPVAPPEWRR
jgi:hypothetical protein